MLFLSSTGFVSLLSFVASVLAEPAGVIPPEIGCGHAMWRNMTSESPTAALRTRSFKPLRDVGSHIKVYWEVVAADTTVEGGYISDDQIYKQIDVLNRDFEPVGLSFELAKIQRTLHPTWARLRRNANDRSQEIAMKNTILMNDPAMLRVYSNINPKQQGWAFVPTWYRPSPQLDGIVLWAGFLPSPDHPGHELTHEVGHWSGLDHTFFGGCSSIGDNVPDTPPQLDSTWQCTRPRYSCGGGLPDAADNYMNYVPDECRKRFTPGQIERMRTHLKRFRGVTIRAPPQKVGPPIPFRPETNTRQATGRPPNQATRYRHNSSYRRPALRYGLRRPATPTQRPSTPYMRPATLKQPTSSNRPATSNRPSAPHNAKSSLTGSTPVIDASFTSASRKMYDEISSGMTGLWKFMKKHGLGTNDEGKGSTAVADASFKRAAGKMYDELSGTAMKFWELMKKHGVS